MAAPFIVRAISKIHPGQADSYRPVAAEFCKLTEEAEPRLLGFHIFTTEDETAEAVIQIHPDAESMLYHLDVMGAKVRETFAYADFTALEVYGQPNDALLQYLTRATEGIPLTVYPTHWGGFTRIGS